MSIKVVSEPPKEITYYEDAPDHDIEDQLTEKHVDDIVEIFQTPLTGAYNWDYDSADGRIRKLYRLGKELNWNAELDIDWDRTYPKTENPNDPMLNPFAGWEPFESMTHEEQIKFAWHNHSWTLSQFLHGEQGALLVASAASFLCANI